MKEQLIKTLLKKSEISASEELTNRLMLKIEAEKKPSETAVLRLKSHLLLPLAILLIFTGMILYFGHFPSIFRMNIEYQTIKTPLFVILLFLVLASLNQTLRAYYNLKRFEK